MESADEEEAIEEGYEEYDPAYEVDDDSITEEDEEFIEEASKSLKLHNFIMRGQSTVFCKYR